VDLAWIVDVDQAAVGGDGFEDISHGMGSQSFCSCETELDTRCGFLPER
jgi:hypothetical protein